MIKFSKEKVLLLHKLIARETGVRVPECMTCSNEG